MLDIKLIRENPRTCERLIWRNVATQNVLQMLEELITVDKEWRLNLTKLNELRHDRKLVTIEIAKLKKAGKEATDEVHKSTRH